MRFVWAVTALVLATVMIGAGIAQRTVFQAPETITVELPVASDAPYLLIDGEVLGSNPGAQSLRIDGEGEIIAAYGRTSDLEQWLAPTEYLHVTTDGEGGYASETREATFVPEEGAAAPTLTPRGSDLWLEEFVREDVVQTTLQLPADMSILVATDGTAPAAEAATVTWPTGVTTPWAGPLIVAGGILFLIGLVLYALALRHLRRSRGPRRKGVPALPEDDQGELDGGTKGVISASPVRRALTAGRKALPRGGRALVAVPALAVTAALVSGCSADAWPDFDGTPSPTPSESVIIPEGQGTPAVTDAQAARILERIAAQTATADEKKDADAAAQRLTGPALAERKTNYRLTKAIKDFDALPAIPTTPIHPLLPQAYEGWPRMFLAVVEESGSAATIMTVTQESPWTPYKLSHIASLAPTATMNLAASYIGAVAVPPDSSFLLLAPNQVAKAYADVLDKGDKSEFSDLFDAEADAFREQVAETRAQRLADFNKTGAQTGKLAFRTAAGAGDPLSLVTLDSGAIVAVTITENDTVTPTDEDAVIKVDNNKAVSTLTGVKQSATGFTTTYTDQLFFFVPAQGSTDRIQLLAYRSNILDAKVVKEQ